jgi:hypothetical protein
MIPTTIPTATVRIDHNELAAYLQKTRRQAKTIERKICITHAMGDSGKVSSVMIEVEGSPPKGRAIALIENGKVATIWVQANWGRLTSINPQSSPGIFGMIASVALSQKQA